jgi:hypothetical protein
LAWADLARTLADATYLSAIGASRAELTAARLDVPRLEAAGVRLLALGEHVEDLHRASVPPLDKLNSKEEELLKGQIADGERIISSVVGKGGQSCVATDRRVLILKLNLTAGASKGATALAYSEIAGVQIRTSLGSGSIEFHKAEMRSTASEISVSFDGKDEDRFRDFEALVAARAAEALVSTPLQLSPPPGGSSPSLLDHSAGPDAETGVRASDYPGAEGDNEATSREDSESLGTAPQDGVPKPDRYAQLRVLGELRAQGILSEDEFQAEKAKILAG